MQITDQALAAMTITERNSVLDAIQSATERDESLAEERAFDRLYA